MRATNVGTCSYEVDLIMYVLQYVVLEYGAPDKKFFVAFVSSAPQQSSRRSLLDDGQEGKQQQRRRQDQSQFSAGSAEC